MNNSKGFTLIELVVVIVILGILAATAAPKFMDLQKDARISSIRGMEGAIKSAVNVVYSKSVIQGTDKKDGYTSSSTGITTTYGYPIAAKEGIIEALQADIVKEVAETTCGSSNSNSDWCYYTFDGDDSSIFIAPKSSVGLASASDTVESNTSCGLKYSVTTTDSVATVKTEVFSNGC